MHKLTYAVMATLVATLSIGCGARQARIAEVRAVKQDPTVRLQQEIAEVRTRIEALEAVPPEMPISEKAVRAEALNIERANLAKLEAQLLSIGDTPAMRQARKNLNREEKDRAKIENAWRKAHDRAEVSGCSPAEEQEMTIEPRATGNWSISDYVKVRVTNTHDFILDSIEDESGQVVSRLCAGGSLSLFRQINTWRDGRYISFQFIARGHFPDGTLGTARSQTFTLHNSGGGFGSGTRFYTWEIRLRPEVQRYIPRPQSRPTQRPVPHRPPTWR